MPTTRRFSLSLVITLISLAAVQAQVLGDLKLDWSDTNNPNGAWTYREGNNALPAVASWQSSLGGWSSPQPGWARSENGTNRIPFIFRSNGTETFTHDWQQGDIVLHSRDDGNGVGNGEGNIIWTSTITGFIDVTGNTWLGRDIGRGNTWSIWKNNTQLTSGVITNGDVFNRASPFDFAAGSGGASVLTSISVVPGDTIMYQLVRTSASGEFAGITMTITAAVPEPATWAMISLVAVAGCAAGWNSRRRRTVRS